MEVRESAIDRTAGFEEFVGHLYLDTGGNVTVGYGHMVPTAAAMAALSMTKGGKPAAKQEKEAEWTEIKKQAKGYKASYYKQFCKLEMSEPDARALLKTDLEKSAADLLTRFPKLDDYPEEAQDALLDMMFNIGITKFNSTSWPGLFKAVVAMDWKRAATESHRKPPIPEARNKAIADLFLEAAKPLTDESRMAMLSRADEVVRDRLSDLRRWAEELGLGPSQCGNVRIRVAAGDTSIAIELAGASAPDAVADSWKLLSEPRDRDDRIATAKQLHKEGATYTMGCSGFICAVLGISHEQANALMGSQPVSVGTRPPYPKLKPGDIVGWKEPSASGHVALYIGESDDKMFIDVQAPGKTPRIKNGYYDRELFKASRFN